LDDFAAKNAIRDCQTDAKCTKFLTKIMFVTYTRYAQNVKHQLAETTVATNTGKKVDNVLAGLRFLV
jgi:hypothetical protein